MVEELQRIFAQVEQQPDDVQRRIAELIGEELDERAWQSLVVTPESQRFLTRLAAEARREIAAGETQDLDELL